MSDPALVSSGLKLNDRYVIEKELGRGGIGVVYLARDEQLHARPVVIKVLLDQTSGSDWFQKKFRGEVEALVRIDHPGVVGALDSGRMPDGKPFLVMQYVQGVTLRSMMKKAPIEPPVVADLVRQIGAALTAAHEAGVHHRDLKPENVMVRELGHGERQAKIIDFGIASVLDPADAGTQMTQVAGSVLYMAPEQLMGRPQAASDIYALAVMAYELLAGEPPFRPHSPYELLNIQREGVKRPPSEVRPGLPPSVDAVVLRSLALEPKDRHLTARQFAEELARALAGPSAEAPTARPAAPTEIVSRGAAGTPPTVVPAPTVPASLSAAAISGSGLEMAHVLFTDVIGYSVLPMDHQRDVLAALQSIVQNTAEYRRAQAAQQLVSLPTGDGMALVFFGDPTAPVRCAMEVARELKARPAIGLRMGIHSGPVYRVADINANLNVAGGGINVAQRVMDSGDAGHILLSRTVADVVGQLSEWSASLRDLGEHAVKHGVRVQLFNLCTAEVGNPAVPSKLRAAASSGRPERSGPGGEGPRSKAPLVAGGAALALAALVAAVFLLRGRPEPVAPSPGPPAVRRELTYYLTVQKYQDGQPYREPFRLAREMLFGPEDRLRLTVTSAQPGFLYIVNEGPDTSGGITYNVLHPKTTVADGSAALVVGTEVHIPSAQSYFRFDAARGTESLWLVFSNEPVPEMEAVKGAANPVDRGAIKDPALVQRVREFLDRHRTTTADAATADGSRSTVLRSPEPVLVSLLKLEHM